MPKQLRPSKVFVYQSIGFLAIIAVCMFDEVVGLTSLILGEQPYISNFRGSILKMLLVLGVWLVVAGSTRRVIARIRYLEGFMKVCAWCHRIEHQHHWMPLEEFLKKGFDTPTSHGICIDCQDKMKVAIDRANESKNEPSASPVPGVKSSHAIK
jgi:hypothetical protein